MTAEPSFLGGWDRVLSGAIGVLLGFGLAQAKEWLTRRRKHAAFWHAINAELEFSGGKAASFSTENVEAPLYRLPKSSYESCYPQLLADGALTRAESTALMAFFNEIETLNRGLDLATNASDADKRREEYRRNRVKAKRVASGGPLYDAAAPLPHTSNDVSRPTNARKVER